MPRYRLYFTHDGHIRSAAEIEAADDEAAIVQCEGLRERAEAELWDRARLIRKFESFSQPREDASSMRSA